MTEKRESINEIKQTNMITAAQCMSDANHSFRTKSKNMDGLNCPICSGPVMVKPFDKEEYYKLPYYMDLLKPPPPPAQKEPTSLYSLSVNVDVSEGIKALKALQREAKETVRVLKEVEDVTNNSINIKGERNIRNV